MCSCLDRRDMASGVREHPTVSPLWVEDIKQQKLPAFHTGRPCLTSFQLIAEAVKKMCYRQDWKCHETHGNKQRPSSISPLSVYTHPDPGEDLLHCSLYGIVTKKVFPAFPLEPLHLFFLQKETGLLVFNLYGNNYFLKGNPVFKYRNKLRSERST